MRMHSVLRILAPATALVVWVGASASAQQSHVVRLTGDEEDNYRFEPAEVTARPGDVLVFRVASGSPHSVVFEAGGLSPDVRAALDGAMPNRSAELSSPLLTAAGAQYRIVVPPIPAGSYEFYCLPHRAYDMRGRLTVK
jgi:plastocyanin